jgi:tRNA threonylcarbamoyladenosine biosynthesis protein TsaB
MRLLALETATAATGVALLEDGRVLAEVEGEAGKGHAAALLPAVERALTQAGVGLEEIDAFAVSIGPGSFTGLRIGLASLKAFAFGTPKPVAAVPTLAALAWPLREEDGRLVACLDAQRGELYAAGWRGEAGGLAPCDPAEGVYRPEDLAALLRDQPGDVILVGEGLDPLAKALPGIRVAPPTCTRPRAASVGALGARMLARGLGEPASGLVPRYLRRAEAEARRTGDPLEPAGERRSL